MEILDSFPIEESGNKVTAAKIPPMLLAFSAKVEYSLTDQGLTLMPILDSMYKWGKNYIENVIGNSDETKKHIK